MIVYALIARASTDVIFVEHSLQGASGNFATVTNTLLKRLTLEDGSRRTFVYDQNTTDEELGRINNNDVKNNYVGGSNFYYVSQEKGILYICLSDDAGQQRKVFSFLEDLRTKFIQKYSDRQRKNAIAYGMDKAFSPTISVIMHEYNTDPNAGARTGASMVNDLVENTKNIMSKNIDKVLSRGDQIDLVVEKADAMEIDSKQFVRKSREIKKSVEYRDWQIKMGIIACVGFGIFLIVITHCGLFLGKCMGS